MRLIEAWSKREEWNKEYFIPSYDREAMKLNTSKAPIWLHFGAGNIVRALIGAAMDQLLDQGLSDRGIIVCEDFDQELVYRAYDPYDCLSLLVTLKADGSVDKRVVGSVTEAVTQTCRMEELFCEPSVQIISFTITEKGYSGPLMRKIVELCLERYHKGAFPVALLSLDNCAHNGELLSEVIMKHAKELVAEGKAEKGYLQYLEDKTRISFPWSMIDKITPRPDSTVQKLLQRDGFEDTELIITKYNTYTAPYVNAEETEYLVIEDSFPNKRPKLEAAGILFADRVTVELTEKMKVGTCLNPLHTALAVFGCLLGYKTIYEEMMDTQLKKLVYDLGYKEGMPVVVNPGILKPEEFLKDVLTKRLPNSFMPDSPQRIVTDTSQKIPIRFGQTLKAYLARPDLDITELTMIPLVFAGWLRYLMCVGDDGIPFEPSNDPKLDELRDYLQGINIGKDYYIEPENESENEQIIHENNTRITDKEGRKSVDMSGVDTLLKDQTIFGVDLFACGLADKVKSMFAEMIEGPGAVRNTLVKYCTPQDVKGDIFN